VTNWEIQGRQVDTCNCDAGCPCQFNSLPTHGSCEAVVGIEVDKGHFGDVKLDGVKAVVVLSWPGAIHHGNGRAQIIVDAGANQEQREAMLTILSGQETEPGATVFNVFASTFTEVLEPLSKAISLEIDIERRKSRVAIEGLVESSGYPILNPVTGAEHQARINLPNGFEYRTAEVGRAAVKTSGPIAMSFSDRHALFCRIHMTQSGVVG
jgi:hypothetical protein